MSRFHFDSQVKSVGAGVTVSLFSITIPKTVTAKVVGISTFIRDTAALGSLRWKLLYDGGAVLPFENITTLIGEEGKLMDVPEDYKEFRGGGVLALVAINDHVSIPFDAGGSLKVRFDNPVDLGFVSRQTTRRVPVDPVVSFLRRFFI